MTSDRPGRTRACPFSPRYNQQPRQLPARRTFRIPVKIPVLVLLLLQTGCGAAQFAACAPHVKETGTPQRTWVECFADPLSHEGTTHSVYCLNEDTSKPPVILLHEMTGLTPGTLAYAEELANDFTVYVPLLFGEKGAFSPASGLRAYWFGGMIDHFPYGEWGIPPQGSPAIVEWLRSLVMEVGTRHEGQPIGIIGNCMTGSLPLALLDHQQVKAVVVAQPALPMKLWWSSDENRASLGLSPDDLEVARRSSAKIYGLRFETDCMADRAKHLALRRAFGDRFMDGEIPAAQYQPNGKPVNVHSTLIASWGVQGPVGEASRAARERVRAFLLQELAGRPPHSFSSHH
ncbi:MAG: hypothetical protein NNA21_11315 [Nitrospira sp.]|nr:hypothetical protein [Nitrospira sp.]MCP9460619.1 hypothetical protein [Nitrospira sp.]MCP9475113.1 hypothetical protein [Nitrospira sp.]